LEDKELGQTLKKDLLQRGDESGWLTLLWQHMTESEKTQRSEFSNSLRRVSCIVIEEDLAQAGPAQGANAPAQDRDEIS
jgi:hypothetical protein